MKQNEFELIRQHAVEGADNTVALAFEIAEKDHATAFVQITGTRILATLIASIMANRNCTYAEAQMTFESGLAKESHHIFNEIKNGEREGL